MTQTRCWQYWAENQRLTVVFTVSAAVRLKKKPYDLYGWGEERTVTFGGILKNGVFIFDVKNDESIFDLKVASYMTSYADTGRYSNYL